MGADRRCPGCGKPYEYRIPRRFEHRFNVAAEYRCGPHGRYVYVHAIPPEQAIDIAYRPDGGVVADGGQPVADHLPDIPVTVDCPCGDGVATVRPTAIEERHQGNGELQQTWLYKHPGCSIGGHIVTVDGRVLRRAGPLFSGQTVRALATDGGADDTEGVYL